MWNSIFGVDCDYFLMLVMMIFVVLYVYVMYIVSLYSSGTGIPKYKTDVSKSTKSEEA